MYCACADLLRRSRPRQKPLTAAQGLALFDQMRPANSTAAGLGPMAALQSLDERGVSLTAKKAWLEESRLDAILGASSRSHKSVRSGTRCWMAFVGAYVHSRSRAYSYIKCIHVCAGKYDQAKRQYFLPPLDLLLSWATIFCFGQTHRNYLGYVQTLSPMFNVPVKACTRKQVVCVLVLCFSFVQVFAAGAEGSNVFRRQSAQFQTPREDVHIEAEGGGDACVERGTCRIATACSPFSVCVYFSFADAVGSVAGNSWF